MAENYKHLYEQTKKMLTMYQDELIPGVRKTIAELEEKSKWIPVTERLPDEDGTYLVCTAPGTVTTARFYAFKSFPATKHLPALHRPSSWQSNRNVTHWMPLPEAPKEVQP